MGGSLTTIERLESRIQFAGGTIDTTFGTDGSATFDYKPPLASGNWSLGDGGFTQDSLGRIYGFTAASSGDTARRLVIARLTRDGQIDTSFAENGYRVLERNLATLNTTDHPQVAVDALNRSYILDGSVLWRLTPGGKLDRTFNVKAKVVMTSMTKYEDLTTDANGLAYVAGTSQGKTGTRMTVVRFTELGAADTSYGFEGAYKSPVPGKTGDKSRASSAKLIQFVGDDLMVAGTYTYSRYDAEYPGYFAHNATWTVRLDASGNVDSSYGTNGYAEHDYVNSDVAWGSARPTTIAPDGTVFGATTGGTDYPDGDPASFGSNFKISSDGQAVQSVNIATGQQDTDFDLESVTSPVAVESNGNVIAIGPSAKLFRSRLNNTIDTTFGDTGYVTGPAADVQIAYDGTILYLDTQTRSKITRLWNSDRPVAQIDTKNLRAARTTATRFSIFWRDDDGMNESSIDDTDVRVTGPFDGVSKTRTAIVESKEKLSDGRIFVVYRVTSPGGWTNADNGLFSIKVLGNTIQDKNGVGNLAQTLGSFRVKIG